MEKNDVEEEIVGMKIMNVEEVWQEHLRNKTIVDEI